MSLAARFRGFMPVVIDIETGGFDANRHAILEMAAVFLDLDEEACTSPAAGSRRLHRDLVLSWKRPRSRSRG